VTPPEKTRSFRLIATESTAVLRADAGCYENSPGLVPNPHASLPPNPVRATIVLENDHFFYSTEGFRSSQGSNESTSISSNSSQCEGS